MKEALFYQTLEKNKVQCNLCPHHCTISNGKTGNCKVRENKDGTLYSINYAKPVAQSIDPIEKKPLFHFYPGTTAYSIATVGCNMHCHHCQNYSISQVNQEIYHTREVTPEEIVLLAQQSGATSIAYTYTEPTIFYEYAYDIIKLAKEKELKNVFVTNGFIEKEPLDTIAPYLDGANIDLKSMSEDFYKNICGASLQPVLDSIKRYYEHGIWIEITTLLIPGYNEDEKELRKIAQFIYDINSDIPWHVTGFYPTYKLTNVKPTPLPLLEHAVNIGKKQGLSHVYQGNTRRGENTYCPQCGTLLIIRDGYHITKNNLVEGSCSECHAHINGIWADEKNIKRPNSI